MLKYQKLLCRLDLNEKKTVKPFFLELRPTLDNSNISQASIVTLLRQIAKSKTNEDPKIKSV